jgi:ribosomal protein L12E/L44/L45/RPP1/RPP2
MNTLLIVCAACEIHPTALLKALETRSLTEALDQATARAVAAGVDALPAVA